MIVLLLSLDHPDVITKRTVASTREGGIVFRTNVSQQIDCAPVVVKNPQGARSEAALVDWRIVVLEDAFCVFQSAGSCHSEEALTARLLPLEFHCLRALS